MPFPRNLSAFCLSLICCGLNSVGARAIEDMQVAAQTALCREYSGAIADYGKSVQAAYQAAVSRGVKVIGLPFALFAAPVEEPQLVTTVTNWKICVISDAAPTRTPDDGFVVEIIPAQREVSLSCKDVPDAKACHDSIAQYLKQNKLGILGTYISAKDPNGTLTMSVPVGLLPQP